MRAFAKNDISVKDAHSLASLTVANNGSYEQKDDLSHVIEIIALQYSNLSFCNSLVKQLRVF